MILTNYQDSGVALTPAEANNAIVAARQATPTMERDKFRSVIRYRSGILAYEWYWILRCNQELP